MLVKRYLSEYDRKKLCMILLGLNIIQMFVSMSVFALGGYLSLSINSKAHLIKGYSLKPISATLSACSVTLFLLHCLGAKASNDCCYLRTRHRFENKLLLIVLGYVVMSLVLMSVSILCVVDNMKLTQSLRRGLLHSMKLYARDRSKKKDFDEIQMEYRCCGNVNYTDWFRIKWMPEKSVPSETDRIFSRKDYLHSVPFSCCDPSHAGPCFHSLVGTVRGQYKHPEYGFFKKGCTEVLLGVLREVTQATAILVLVPFFLELAIAVQTRYLQTSLNDCKRRRNPYGIGNCWLFKRYPYEPDLQAKLGSQLTDLFSSSSSEDSVLYERKGLKHSEDSDISIQRQKRLKNRTHEKKHQRLVSAVSDDIDLKRLLLRQMDHGDANLTPKRRFHPEIQKKTRPGERDGSKMNSKQSGEVKTKLQPVGNGSETKPLKAKLHQKAHQVSNSRIIPEVKLEDARADDSKIGVSRTSIKHREKMKDEK